MDCGNAPYPGRRTSSQSIVLKKRGGEWGLSIGGIDLTRNQENAALKNLRIKEFKNLMG